MTHHFFLRGLIYFELGKPAMIVHLVSHNHILEIIYIILPLFHQQVLVAFNRDPHRQVFSIGTTLTKIRPGRFRSPDNWGAVLPWNCELVLDFDCISLIISKRRLFILIFIYKIYHAVLCIEVSTFGRLFHRCKWEMSSDFSAIWCNSSIILYL